MVITTSIIIKNSIRIHSIKKMVDKSKRKYQELEKRLNNGSWIWLRTSTRLLNLSKSKSSFLDSLESKLGMALLLQSLSVLLLSFKMVLEIETLKCCHAALISHSDSKTLVIITHHLLFSNRVCEYLYSPLFTNYFWLYLSSVLCSLRQNNKMTISQWSANKKWTQ